MTVNAYDKTKIDTEWFHVDFDGPCDQCLTDCEQEWEEILTDKFQTGFVVHSPYVDPCGGLKESAIFHGEYPRFTTKGNPSLKCGEDVGIGNFTTIPISREPKIGDIRVAYSDHWNAEDEQGGSVRTFMKRPEEYWALKAIPVPSQGSMSDAEYEQAVADAETARQDYIVCRHMHTDSSYRQSLVGDCGGFNPQSGQEFPANIDDCVTGIWDFNVVDTSTVIEEIGVYEEVHLWEIVPVCGNKNYGPPHEVTSSLFHIWDSDPPRPPWDHRNCCVLGQGQPHGEVLGEDIDGANWYHFFQHVKCHPQPCGCGQLRSMGGRGVTVALSPWCDHTLSTESKHPHRLGTQLYGSPGKGTYLYDNEGQQKKFVMVRETYLYQVGTIWKTTFNKHTQGFHADFQAPSKYDGQSVWTLQHPESQPDKKKFESSGSTGDGTTGIDGGGQWCVRKDDGNPEDGRWAPLPPNGTSHLLELPCMQKEECITEGIDTTGCCSKFADDWCAEQKEHIFFSEQDALVAFDTDERSKTADFEKNTSREKIFDTVSWPRPVTCETGRSFGWCWILNACETFGKDRWERCLPDGAEKHCPPKYGCYGAPPDTTLFANWEKPNATAAFNSGASIRDKIVAPMHGATSGILLGNSCDWIQSGGAQGTPFETSETDEEFSAKPDQLVHCKAGDTLLVAAAVYEGEFQRDGNQIKFELVKNWDFSIPRILWPDGGAGGTGGTIEESIANWTRYDRTKRTRKSDTWEMDESELRFSTDYEAAEQFWKITDRSGPYWYEITAKPGLSIKYMGLLNDSDEDHTYLSTDEMTYTVNDPAAEEINPFTNQSTGESRCATPARVVDGTIGDAFTPVGDNFCGVNEPIEGCEVGRVLIYTGHGDPAPRFDQGQRINYTETVTETRENDDGEVEEVEVQVERMCHHKVDEIFGLSDKFIECVGGELNPTEDDDEDEEDDEDDDSEGTGSSESKTPVSTCKLLFGHKPYIKLRDCINGDDMWTCGIPIGDVDRSVIGHPDDDDFCYCYTDEKGIFLITPDFEDDGDGNEKWDGRSLQELCTADVPENPGDPNGYGGEWLCDNFAPPLFEEGICSVTWDDLGEGYGYSDSPNKYCGLVPAEFGGGNDCPRDEEEEEGGSGSGDSDSDSDSDDSDSGSSGGGGGAGGDFGGGFGGGFAPDGSDTGDEGEGGADDDAGAPAPGGEDTGSGDEDTGGGSTGGGGTGGGSGSSDSVEYFPVSCSACVTGGGGSGGFISEFSCQDRPSGGQGCNRDRFDKAVGTPNQYYACTEGSHCCRWLISNPNYVKDWQGKTADQLECVFLPEACVHPNFPGNSRCDPTSPWCEIFAYTGGVPHSPYNTGYLWHTIFGWNPDTATSVYASWRYHCTEGKANFDGNEENMVWDCCDGKAKMDYGDDIDTDSETVECKIREVEVDLDDMKVVVIPPTVPDVYLL